ncbi:MAG: hypothetical protein F6K19_44725 [Cyanothece sp. SIO1E1]|nr:hypothetical protein [Cyanothece sp. SIO1E1]
MSVNQLERLRHYRHQRLLLEEARPGSLTLIGLIAGVSYFVIEKTVGESFAEGYRESEFHRRLKEFFRRLIDEKALKIAESIRRLLNSRKFQAQVRALPATNESPNIIVIDISPDPTLEGRREPQPLGEALDDRL